MYSRNSLMNKVSEIRDINSNHKISEQGHQKVTQCNTHKLQIVDRGSMAGKANVSMPTWLELIRKG